MKKEKKQNIVVKSNQMIEASYRLSLQEQRIILYMASMIQPNDENFRPVILSIKEFADVMGVKNTHHTYMHQVTRELLTKVITIKEDNSLLQVGWLSSARYFYNEGYVSLSFDPELKPYLLQLKERFTKYQLSHVIRLKHSYSIRFYELLKQYENIGWRYITLKDLRNILGVGENEYKLYGDFKKKIIAPSKKEFDLKYKNQELDFTFEYEEKKDGKKVVGLKFEILKPPIKLELFDKDGADKNSIIDIDHDDLIAELITFKLSKKQINNLFKKYPVDQIKSNIEVTSKKIKAKEVKNPPAFLLEAIEGNYAKNQIEVDYNPEYSALILEANKCWANSKGSCAGVWENYKNLKNKTCYFCKKFEKQRRALPL